MTYTRAESNTDVTVDVTAAGIQSVAWGFSISNGITCTLSASGANDSVGTGGFTSPSGGTVSKSLVTRTGNAKYRWTRGKSAATKTVKVTTVNSSGYMNGTSSKSISVTVPALASYTITFDANGGSGAPGSQTKWYGETLTLSTTKPTRTGHTFLGWSTSDTATAATWEAGGSYTTNASDTLYAVWQANTFTVSYNANGGEDAPESQTKTYGVDLTLSSVEPTRTGYDFLGWAISSSATVATWAAGGTYANDASAVLYAVWAADTYTITFDANNGTGAPAAQTKTYGVPLELSSTVPTRTNYDFLGWSTSSTATTAAYAAGGTYTANEDALLYAVWKTAYWSPKLTDLAAKRVTPSGEDDDEGTYIHVSFAWEVCTLVPNAAATCTATVLLNGTQEFQNTIDVSGTSGTKSVILTNAISTDYSYNLVITFTDTYGGTSSATTIVSQSFFMLDFMKGGHGVGIGSPALETDVMRVGFDIHGLGDLSMDGNVSGTDGTFTGAVSGTTGTFSGAVSGTTGTFTGAVSANGATLTDNVTLYDGAGSLAYRSRSELLDRDSGTAPSSWQYADGLELHDKDDETIGRVYTAWNTSNAMGTGIEAITEDSNGNEVMNFLRVWAYKDGTKTFSVGDSDNFRSAISAARASWVSLGSFKGTNSLTIDLTDYNEVMVAAKYDHTYNSQTSHKLLTAVVAKQLLTSTAQELWLGGGKSGNSTGNSGALRAVCNITTTRVTGVVTSADSTDHTSGTTWYVYAR